MGVGSMGGLYIGVSGLQVNQTALNATAHNLANLDSDGYSRQQVLIRDSIYSTYATGAVNSMQTGLGTTMEKIRQVRDTFADKQYRLETGRESFYDAMYGVAEEIESYFGSDVDEGPLKNALTEFWESLNELQKSPGSIVNRQTVIQAAQELVQQSKMIYNQISDYQENLNVQLQTEVAKVNEIGEQIHQLNLEIMKIEAGGAESANDLRDQRNSLLDELATYADISYREDNMGSVTVNIEGTSFVTEDRVFRLGTQLISEDSELLTIVWADHGNMELYSFDSLPSASNSTDVGSMKGLLFARGTEVGNYTLMNENSLDWQAVKNADGSQTYASLEEYYAGEGYSDYAEYYEKNIQPYLVTNLSTQLDYLMHTVVTTINDILCPNTTTTADISTTDSEGNTITIAAGTTVLDVENAPISLGDDGYPGVELFSRTNTPRYTEYTYTDENGDSKTLYVYSEENPKDTFSQYTIDQLQVNPLVIKNPSLIPISNQDHSNAQDVVNNLLDAWSCEGDYENALNTLTPNTLTGYDIQGYYNAMINDLANLGNSYNNIAQNQESVANQLNNRRQIVSGVSSDEELSNMIVFQQGYNAASRYINVVADMLDTLINKL